jgi:hypothetical protein
MNISLPDPNFTASFTFPCPLAEPTEIEYRWDMGNQIEVWIRIYDKVIEGIGRSLRSAELVDIIEAPTPTDDTNPFDPIGQTISKHYVDRFFHAFIKRTKGDN